MTGFLLGVEVAGAGVTYLALNSDYRGWWRVLTATLWFPILGANIINGLCQ